MNSSIETLARLNLTLNKLISSTTNSSMRKGYLKDDGVDEHSILVGSLN